MIRLIQRLKHKKGFTLVEMVVTLAIISVLASMLIPQLGNMIILAKVTGVNASAAEMRKAISGFMIQMTIDNTGMKRGKRKWTNGQDMSTTAQIIWSVNNYNWMVKTECKPCLWNGTSWTELPGRQNCINAVYNDGNNWYKDNFQYVDPDCTRYNPNHLLALTVAVRECVPDLRSGFVMAFFDEGICKGLVFMPEWRCYWPASYDSYADVRTDYCQGMNGKKRPRLLRCHLDSVAGTYCPEFDPWHGVWPKDVDDRIWADDIPGLCAESGLFVGTSPTILSTPGRRAYSSDWEDPIPNT